MVRLPVSGAEVLLSLPDGSDEMALGEARERPLQVALALLARVASRAGHGADTPAGGWADLPVTDVEVLLLRLRQRLLGDLISSDVHCPACRERAEVSFRVEDYLAAVRPARPRDVTAAPREGWLAFGDEVFRLPSAADVLAVQGVAAPGAALRARCRSPGAAAGRIDRVIARMAPPVSGPVGGSCPGCGGAIEAVFDVAAFVVAELKRLVAGVHLEVHLLARAYGWSEAAILALPGARRRRYAALVGEGKAEAQGLDADDLAVA